MDFGSDDANDGWAEVGSHTFGDDVGNGLRFANSGALELDDLEESGSDEEDYIVKFDSTDGTRKTCCRRCCRCFWCWKLPILRLPLSPLLFWNIIFLGIFVPLFILKLETEPKLAGVELRWWALAFVILCVAAILSRLAVGLLYFIGEIIVSKSDRIFYYINDLEWPFALLGWGIGMLITLNVWLKDLEPPVFKAFHIIFIMTIVAAVARVVQIVLVKLISSMMNKKRFWADVTDSLFRQRLILKLLAGKRKYRAAQMPGVAAKDQSVTSDAIGTATGVNRQPTARTLAARERLSRLVSFKRIKQMYVDHQTQQNLLEVLRPKDEKQLAREKRAIIRTAKAGSEASKIGIEAKIDGNRVFDILDLDRKGYIVSADLVGFFKDEAKEAKAFKILQPPPHHKTKLSRKDVVKSVDTVYKDREKLVRNMKDRQSVAGVLSKIIAVILFLVAVIIFITLIGVDFLSFIAPFGTAVLAISFVFGSAAASAFKSFVFLIFVNPFDVGDRISIEDKVILKVIKISLLSTTCETPQGLRAILPNYRLADANIYNFTRARHAALFVELEIDIDTPVNTLLEFKTLIYKWLKKNRQVWDTEFGFQIRKVVQQRALMVGIWVSLTNITWASPGPLFTAKTDFMIFLKEASAELNIECFGAEAKITVDFEDEPSQKRTQRRLERQHKLTTRKPADSDGSDGDDENDDDTVPLNTQTNDSIVPPRTSSKSSIASASSAKSLKVTSPNPRTPLLSQLDDEDGIPPANTETISVASSSTKSKSSSSKPKRRSIAVNFSDMPSEPTPPVSPDQNKSKKAPKKSGNKSKTS